MFKTALLILPVLALPLGGCVASMAMSAAGAAVQAARGPERVATDDRRAGATEACRARGASEGTVQIIDSEQRRDGRVTVYGTVQNAAGRRAFECVHDGRVLAFRLREIRTR